MASTHPIPLNNLRNGYTIVTQVIPSSDAVTADRPPTHPSSPLGRFLKGEPKALGTVQIMNGLFTLFLALLILGYSYFSFIGYGLAVSFSIIHLIAGSLTVSTSKRLHPCKVKWTLCMNIFSALSAVISIILISMYLMFSNRCYGYECRYYYQSPGLNGTFLVFSLLQFSVSVAITVFASKATCSDESSMNVVSVVPNPESCFPMDTSFSAPFTHMGFGATNAMGVSSTPAELPPSYSETKRDSDN
ncbi:membrane-spanning 4-domains subfamily A member 4A-like [Silurus meridionalis]|nr:membrane-spanning 4-domains subfamily A member 4A-like [Silurus meridionalis]